MSETGKNEIKFKYDSKDFEDLPTEKKEISPAQQKWEKASHDTENITDDIGCSVDEKIKETVTAFNAFEINTSGSCEGHIEKGAGVTWIEIVAKNKPEEEYVGEKSTIERIALENNISVDELKKEEKYENLLQEAKNEFEKNGKTEKAIAWQEENEKLRAIMEDVVSDFYQNRDVSEDVKLKFRSIEDFGDFGRFRIISGTHKDYERNPEAMSGAEKEELGKRLEKNRKEMKDFTDFLKEKLFDEGESYINDKKSKAQEKIDKEKIGKIRKSIENGNVKGAEVSRLIDFDEEYFRSISAGDKYDWIAIGMENCKNQKYYTVVGKDNVKLGIVGIYDTDDEQNITHIIIDPKFRGKGLLSKFYDQLLEKENLTSLTAIVNIDNKASINSHEKAGFEKVSDEDYEKQFLKYKYTYTNTGDSEYNLKNKNQEAPEIETKDKLMVTPEITIESEEGINLMSFMLKGYDPGWGDKDHELSKAANEHFKNNPLGNKVRKSLNDLKVLKENGINQESLFNISLSYRHPERLKETSANLIRDEEVKNPDELQTKLLKLMEEMEKELNLNTDLRNKFDVETKKDIEIREKYTDKSEKEIEKLINFFRPKKETTKAKKIIIIPTDHLYEKESGMGFSIGEEIIIRAPLKDFTESNQWTHEFLHSVINPINDKLSLTDEQKKKIIKMSPGDQVEHYKGNAGTLLNEGFIRTYVNFFEGGKGPFTYEYLKKIVSETREEEFQESLKYVEFKQNMNAMGISNLMEFSENLEEYFEKYKKDLLGNIIYGLYEDYQDKIQNNKEQTFEDFVLEKFPGYLDKAKL